MRLLLISILWKRKELMGGWGDDAFPNTTLANYTDPFRKATAACANVVESPN